MLYSHLTCVVALMLYTVLIFKLLAAVSNPDYLQSLLSKARSYELGTVIWFPTAKLLLQILRYVQAFYLLETSMINWSICKHMCALKIWAWIFPYCWEAFSYESRFHHLEWKRKNEMKFSMGNHRIQTNGMQ
jgi:hypothetical protein